MTRISSGSGFPIAGLTLLPMDSFQMVRAPEEALKARAEMEANKAMANDPAATAQYNSTQAHTVFRQNGRVLAIVWRDGIAEIQGSVPGGFKRIAEQTKGMSKEQVADFYAQELEKVFGAGVTAERYSGRADAPTRADYAAGRLFTDADYRFGRRVSVIV